MMISNASSTIHQPGKARHGGLLALVPPRHSKLALAVLYPGRHLIGSNSACTIQVAADGVQSHHAMILVGEQKVLLKALDSRTWVNDSVVAETVIRPGDRVSVGPITFQVRMATADEMRETLSLKIDPEKPNGLPNPSPVLKSVELESQIVRQSSEELHVKSPSFLRSVDAAPILETAAVELPVTAEEPIATPECELADEVARQTKAWQERDAEHDHRMRMIEATRRELVDDYARQTALSREREDAHRRSTEELKCQREEITRQRAELQVESENITRERVEIQRLRSEYDREMRAGAIERTNANIEIENFHVERTAFESERRNQLAALHVREDQFDEQRRALAVTEEELLAFRKSLEQERTHIAAERSSESLRREQEIRDYSIAQARLSEQQARLREQQSRLSEQEVATRKIQWALQEEQNAFKVRLADLKREREEIDATRAELDRLRAELAQTSTELVQTKIELDLKRQSQREIESAVAYSEREARHRRDELEHWQQSLELRQVHFEEDPSFRPISDGPSLSSSSATVIPPPIPVKEWNLSGFGDPPSIGKFDHQSPVNPLDSGMSVALSAKDRDFNISAELDVSTFTRSPVMVFADEASIVDVQRDFAGSNSATTLCDVVPST